MLISIKELKALEEFKDVPENELERKIKAIEQAIRQITHNNFQNRLKRIVAPSVNNSLTEVSPYFNIGDTIEISESINEGLYTIKNITDNSIELNEPIYNSAHNLCTKIEYPLDIIEGALALLKWELDPNSSKNKTGIVSETLSRHTVQYAQATNNNYKEGYPIELLGFCSKYSKARF